MGRKKGSDGGEALKKLRLDSVQETFSNFHRQHTLCWAPGSKNHKTHSPCPQAAQPGRGNEDARAATPKAHTGAVSPELEGRASKDTSALDRNTGQH